MAGNMHTSGVDCMRAICPVMHSMTPGLQLMHLMAAQMLEYRPILPRLPTAKLSGFCKELSCERNPLSRTETPVTRINCTQPPECTCQSDQGCHVAYCAWLYSRELGHTTSRRLGMASHVCGDSVYMKLSSTLPATLAGASKGPR